MQAGSLPPLYVYAGLTRCQSPWVLGPVEWTPLRIRQAVTWLSQRAGKPLLKLTDADYNAHSLQVSTFK